MLGFWTQRRYNQPDPINNLFPCSSMVEQIPVKNEVVGSSPTGGAKLTQMERF